MINRVLSLQKNYGKTRAEVETIVEGFAWVMRDITIDAAEKAFLRWLESSAQMPTPADIMGLISMPRPNSEPTERLFPWEEKNRKRRAMVEAFMDDFRGSPLYQTARSEGWGHLINRWVRCTAEIQAQFAIPYDHKKIASDPVLHKNHDGSKMTPADFRRWLQDQRILFGSGKINVEVSSAQVAQWRAHVEHVRQHPVSPFAPGKRKDDDAFAKQLAEELSAQVPF